jgi:hypothetical protein
MPAGAEVILIARIACNETRIRRLGNFVCAIPKTICQIRLLRVSGIHSIAGWSLLFSMFGSRVALVLALAGRAHHFDFTFAP